MHPNPAFRGVDQSRALQLATERAFGVLTVIGGDRVLASHIPFVLDGMRISAHLVRSNPIVRLLAEEEAEALLIVSGPDGYVSPDWYGIDDQVPTWNYVAVHLRGPVRSLPDDELKPHLDHVSGHIESRLLPKKIWTMDKMTPGTGERMMRMIIPIEMDVQEVTSTFKLNQNKDDDVRLRAADHMETSSIGSQTDTLAALMRDPDTE